MSESHSYLLEDFLQTFVSASKAGPILDLACGNGRNGLYLLEQDIPVVFADRNSDALRAIEQKLNSPSYQKVAHLARIWEVDFELPDTEPLIENSFGGIIVYRYLYRPLLAALRNAVIPGGLLVYETFTIDQPQYGRPTNPDFLLRHQELTELFKDWRIQHSFEGVQHDSEGENTRAIAQIVVSKPE